MIDQFPVRKISWVWTLKPSLTTARSFMICPLYWHYAWSWTTARSDFSGWQQKGKERIGFWLHPFKRFNLFSHSSGKKKKKHLPGHLTFFFFVWKFVSAQRESKWRDKPTKLQKASSSFWPTWKWTEHSPGFKPLPCLRDNESLPHTSHKNKLG